MNNEPVAELVLEQMAVGDASSLRVKWLVDNYPPVGTKLYTHPVKELTDEEIHDLMDEIEVLVHGDIKRAMYRMARKVESILNE